MNIIFGIGIALVTAALVFLVLLVVPKKVWDFIPEEHRHWKKTIVGATTGLTFLVVAANSLQAYGPKNTVSSQLPPDPQGVDLRGDVPEFIEESARVGQFDGRLEEKVEEYEDTPRG